MVERKLNDAASKKYWESIEEVEREVKEMPSWMKGGAGKTAPSPNATEQKKSDAKKTT